jgi:hypothetical protein
MSKPKRSKSPGQRLEEERNEIMSGCYWQQPNGERFSKDELMAIIHG